MSELLIEWSDDYSIQIPEIDEQHKVLVGLVNEMHAAIREQRGREECGAVLEQLIEYTRVHFATEESVMSVMRYPELEQHRAEHQKLMDEVSQLKARFDDGSVNLTMELMHFLKAWLHNHIHGSDKRAGAFIVDNPRTERPSWLSRLGFH